MRFDGSDLALTLEKLAGGARQRGINLEALHQTRGGDDLHLGDLGLQTDPAVLVEEHLRVHLFSHLALVPLLLLLPAAGQGSSELLLLCLLLDLGALLVVSCVCV